MSNGNMSFGSKHMWYSIGGAVIVALLAWAIISITIGSVPWALNTDQQATSTDTSSGGGTVTGMGTGKFPASWPADAPALQSGAKITYSGQVDPKTKIVGPTLVYTGSGSAATAVKFFKAQFTAKGWTFRGQGNVQGSVQLAATKDTRKVTVTILETRPGVLNVTIGISKL